MAYICDLYRLLDVACLGAKRFGFVRVAVYPEALDSEIEGLVDAGELTAAAAIKIRVSGVRRSETLI